MIEVQSLTKRYPTRVAVEDVTFSVQSGEIVGFLGPNGAGKTTTMRVLTGFLPPSSGSARIAGHDVVTQSRAARAAVGYLPETAALYPEMRVREYLTFRARLEGVSGAAVRQRVGEAIERCLLAEVADRRIENLSKGFRQRTSLAGALVHQPPVLVLDEPTVGLDPMQIIKIREMIRALSKERAVLLSTHILPEVDAVCDRILIIAEGRIVAEGTAAQLRQKFSSRPVFRATFKGDVAAREALADLAGVTAVEEQSGEKETRVRLECAQDADPSEAVGRGQAGGHLRLRQGFLLRQGYGGQGGGRVMKRFFAIVGREWRAYFFSPLGYVILAGFLLMNGIIFAAIVTYMNQPGAPKGQALNLLFTNTYFWLFNLFVVPVIAMRLFADERKSGTLEVLLTSPVSETEVVLAKFTGGLGFFLTLWAPTLIYVFILRAQTPIDFGPVAAGYLAIVLLGGYFLAVGTFASTLTKNQIVAAIFTFAMLIPIFSAGLLEQMLNSPAAKSLVGYFNLWDHMDEFARGVVDSRRLVYYLSATAFFLFLARVSISAKKETP